MGERALITKRTARWSKLAALAAGVLALAAVTISPSYAANDTEVYIVQGLPGKNLDVEIDGKSVASGVKTAEVAGPFKVKPGKNTVTFSENGSEILKRTFSVKERRQGRRRRPSAGFLIGRSAGDRLQVRRCQAAERQGVSRGFAYCRRATSRYSGERSGTFRQHCQWRVTRPDGARCHLQGGDRAYWERPSRSSSVRSV